MLQHREANGDPHALKNTEAYGEQPIDACFNQRIANVDCDFSRDSDLMQVRL